MSNIKDLEAQPSIVGQEKQHTSKFCMCPFSPWFPRVRKLSLVFETAMKPSVLLTVLLAQKEQDKLLYTGQVQWLNWLNLGQLVSHIHSHVSNLPQACMGTSPEWESLMSKGLGAVPELHCLDSLFNFPTAMWKL